MVSERVWLVKIYDCYSDTPYIEVFKTAASAANAVERMKQEEELNEPDEQFRSTYVISSTVLND